MIPELEAAGVQLVRLDELMPAGWKSTIAKLQKPTEEPAQAPPQEATDSPAPAAAPATGQEAAVPTQVQPVPGGEGQPTSVVPPIPSAGQDDHRGDQAEVQPEPTDAPPAADGNI